MINIRPTATIVSLSSLALASAVLGCAPPAHATVTVRHAPAAVVTRTTAAPAGSMVYLKGDNVWVARADGSGGRRITTDGSREHPYVSPTQADTGEIVAARKERIIRMTTTGRVLTVIDPKPLKNSAGQTMDGTPADVAISPNGRIIAYTFALYGCPSGLSCDTRFATAYTESTRLSDPAVWGTTYYDAPSWVTNARTVTGGGSFSEVNVHDLGQAPMHWFRDSEIDSPARDITDPAVSRDRAWVATIRGWGNTTTVLWSKVNGDLAGGRPQLPTPWCETNEEPGLAGPAFSATSDRLAWTRPDGIWMSDRPADCTAPRLVIPGAKEAGFSLAPFSATPAPVNTSKPSLSGTVEVGKTVTVKPGRWSPAATRYAYQWYVNSGAVKGATTASYKVRTGDQGKKLWVRVKASNTGGSGRADAPARRVRPPQVLKHIDNLGPVL